MEIIHVHIDTLYRWFQLTFNPLTQCSQLVKPYMVILTSHTCTRAKPARIACVRE